MANRKALGPNDLPGEHLRVLAERSTTGHAQTLHDVIVAVCRGDGVPQQSKYAIIKVLHGKKYRTERGNNSGISRVLNAGKVLLKVIAGCLVDYWETWCRVNRVGSDLKARRLT